MLGIRRSTYKVKCPDGTVRTVHRKLDDAFPLYLPNFQGTVAATVRDLGGNNVELKGDLRKGIDGVLYQLSELNDGMMMSFRAVYATYETDPCGNSEYLARKVDELTSELQRLTAARLELRALVELATAQPDNTGLIWKTFAAIVTKHGLPDAPQASSYRIKSARNAAERWIEG